MTICLSRDRRKFFFGTLSGLLFALVITARPAHALTESPAGTLVAQGGDGAISFVVFDGNGNSIPDVTVSGAASGNGTYTDVTVIDATAASAPGVVSVQGGLATNWAVSTSNGGTLGISGLTPLSFGGIQSLRGGSAVDSFTLTAALSGSAWGDGGDDIFVLNGGSAAAIDGGAGSADTIIGEASANVFVVNAYSAGIANGNAFVGIENLTGGAAGDSFAITGTGSLAGTATGAGGTDTLTANDTSNTWALNAANGGSVSNVNGAVAFAGVENLAGGAAADNLTVSGTGSLAGSFNGGGGANSVTGANTANAWALNAANAGSVTNSNGTVAFSNAQSVTGGTAVDTMTLGTADFTGWVSGGVGDDIINVNVAQTGAVNGGAGADTISLQAPIAGGVDGGSESDTIVGTEFADSFVVNAANAGTAYGTAFTGIENLIGAGGNDSFAITGTGSLAGTATGAGGTDTLTANDTSNTWALNAANAGSVSNVNGSVAFASVENLAGGAAADNLTVSGTGSLAGSFNGAGGATGLTGKNTASTWLLNAANAGSVTDTDGSVTFSNVQAVTGGTAVDTMTLGTADFTGWVSGGLGDDIINVNVAQTGAVNGGAGADTISLQAAVAGGVDGGSESDIINVNVAQTGAVNGGAGTDTISLQAAVAGGVDGGSESDTIIGTLQANGFVVNASNAGTVNGIAFVNVENLTGGNEADSFIFTAALAGVANGSLGDDTFTMNTGGSVGTLDGDTGTDTIIGGPSDDVFAVNVTDGGSVNGSSFIGVESLIGSAGDDTFTFTAALTGTVAGFAGADTFAINDGGSAGLILGGVDDDALVGGQAANTFVVNGPNMGTLNGIPFAAIEYLFGGESSDTFVFNGDLTGAAFGQGGADRFEINTLFSGSLYGDAGNDVFFVQAEVAGIIDGGADLDEMHVNDSVLILPASSGIERTTGYRFDDVKPGYWAFSQIEAIAWVGVTAGCTVSTYCPEDEVTRAQMAVFLERALNGSGYAPPAAVGNVFLDVSASHWAADWIEQFYLDGITSGCAVNYYCPDDSVTRAEMAVFLLRSKHGASYLPPAATGRFSDVPLSHWAVNWIEQLAAEGITLGCAAGEYCPEAPVTRAQMAVFLVRTFGY